MERVEAISLDTYVPITRKPNLRTKRSRPPLVDIYGFSPLNGTPFAFLTPFEFFQHWTGEPLVAPSNYNEMEARTKWTDEGKRVIGQPDFKNGLVTLKPRDHYVVLERSDALYYTFPEEPTAIYGMLRHTWVIVRRNRPHVPILEGVPLPSSSRAAEENAKSFSIFFRPWTLDGHTLEVPHITRLGMIPDCPQATGPDSILGCPMATGPDTKPDVSSATYPDAELRLIDIMPSRRLSRTKTRSRLGPTLGDKSNLVQSWAACGQFNYYFLDEHSGIERHGGGRQ